MKYVLFQQLKEKPKEDSDEKINAAIRQVALADFIILNKTDLVTNEQKDDLISAIRTINGASPLLETVKCTVSLDDILDLNAYSGTREDRLTAIVEEVKKHGNTSHLDKDVGTVTLELEKGVTRKCLDLYLQRLLWEKLVSDKKGNPSTVIRFKALCRLTDEAQAVLVQAVYDTYDCQVVDSDEAIGCRFIFIGTHLDKESLHNLLLECMEDADS